MNDIYFDNKKLCGILTEGSILNDGTLDYAVLGIGINVFPPESGFPEDIKDRAGAIFEKNFALDKMLGSILFALMIFYNYNRRKPNKSVISFLKMTSKKI
mgnify:CR=1 FL=1